jgi:iron(III) transport system substrate-binding protein
MAASFRAVISFAVERSTGRLNQTFVALPLQDRRPPYKIIGCAIGYDAVISKGWSYDPGCLALTGQSIQKRPQGIEMLKTKFGRSAMVATCVAFFTMQAGASYAADPALIAAAKKEGEVLWYTTLIINQIVRPEVDAFQKKYGITVKYVRQNTSEVAIKITNELSAGKLQADIFDSTVGIYAMLKPDVLEKIPTDIAKGYPPELKAADGTWVAANLYFLTASYNTELIKPADAPKTYQDLLDPKYKGKIAWTNDPTVNGAPGFIGNILMTMGNDAGMAYLKKLAEQKIVNVPANQRVVLDQVISGQYSIGLMTFNHHAVISAGQGAPVAWIKMEPLINNANYMSLLKGAPHPNAAKLFLDFITSDEGQNVMRDANYIPASPAVAAKTPSLKPDAGGFKVTVITPEIALKNIDNWTKIYNDLFK